MRADGRRNRDALLAAAEQLIAEKGADVPLDEIARRAGVGNATLYRHFPTRRDLLLAVTADHVTALREYAELLIDQDAPAEALMAWLRAFAEHVAAHPALAGPDEAGGDPRPYGQWRADVDDMAMLLLYRARRTGAVRADLETDDLLAFEEGIALAVPSAGRRERLFALLRDAVVAAPREIPHVRTIARSAAPDYR
ncbi:TetR/AcrR family transcriptional regulator [Jiangella gansuensis]|uniref:TetR/AcrR family transcriptional regulator n=1 Tax=Jiangella gansuensis TaxID=281473 RepID=UPI0004B0454F|nr:TetR/AcrR family transcriptional regulator [Jiangella gansuensis]